MNKKTLEQLLEETSRLFRDKDWKRSKLSCYDFSLDRMPYGWVFKVVNSWQKWEEKNLQSQFGAYRKPEDAVKSFLSYVKLNKIKVKNLMEK